MKSFIAALRELTLPFGVTSGGRIVLDGVDGRILIYDQNGTLIAELSPDVNHASLFPWTSFAQPGMLIYDANGDPRILLSSPDETPPFSAMRLMSSAANETNPGTVALSSFGLFNRLVITPGENNSKGSLELTLRSTSADDSEPAMIQVVGLQINPGSPQPIIDFCGGSMQAGVDPPRTVVNDIWYGTEAGFTNPPTMIGSYGRGMVGQGTFDTASDVARAAGVNTDLEGTVDVDITRLYKVHLNSQINVGTAGAVYAVELSEGGTVGANNGTVVGRFSRISAADVPAGSTTRHVSTGCLWMPTVAGNTIVRCRNGTGSGGTIQSVGAATNPRQLWVEDIGLR
jgi:hypothetical protein